MSALRLGGVTTIAEARIESTAEKTSIVFGAPNPQGRDDQRRACSDDHDHRDGPELPLPHVASSRPSHIGDINLLICLAFSKDRVALASCHRK